MGGAVSSGKDNDELVDNLCHEGYITTPQVEAVFRKIDRQDYLKIEEDDDPLEAYEDHAWRRGNLHLSAPCIYSRVMEALKLEKGLSFLNIGSGTGYLSTMAGLILGPTGVNHGIELFPDNVDYANEKLHEFQSSSQWFDPLTFCEPKFVEGNALLLSPSGILYDRVYCGAGCPSEHVQLLKNMLRVGGILVVPQDSELEALTRVSCDCWETEVVLPTVSFAPLILPSAASPQDMTAIEMSSEVKELKKLSGLAVLQALGRERYHLISSLPLPPHLIQLISHNRDWGSPPQSVRILCPIDRMEEEGEGEHKGESVACASRPRLGRRRQGRGADRDQEYNAMMIAPSIANGRRVLFVNMDGFFVPIPVDSDQEDDEEDGALQEAAEAMSSNADTDTDYGSDHQQQQQQQRHWQAQGKRRKRGRMLHQLFARNPRAVITESTSGSSSEKEWESPSHSDVGCDDEDEGEIQELSSEEMGLREQCKYETSLSDILPYDSSHDSSHDPSHHLA